MNFQAVILAGGKGTRVISVRDDIPKSMLPVAGKPLIVHQLEWLRRQGISEAIILVNHLKDIIIQTLGDGSAFGVSISYFEEPYPMGTVGGVKAIEDRLKGDFLLLYGDVMLDLDLARLSRFHTAHESEGTLVVHPNDHPYDSDLVELDRSNRITAFHPKPHSDSGFYRNLVNAGAYLLSKKILTHLEPGVKADFGKDIFPAILTKTKLFGYNTTEYIKDMGTPERLATVSADVASGKVAARNLQHPQRAIFLDRDGVLNEDSHLVASPDELDVYPFAGSAVKKINDSRYLAIVATNQSVIARNKCTEDGLRVIHNKLDTILGRDHARLDAIYYCPHHPDKGFPGENESYKMDCHCRKPKPGMLLDAARDFNIDLATSYFIGDAERDIEAGRRAGVTTVGVMTGKGMMGSRQRPDYLFRNLAEAVDFVLDEPYRSVFDEVNSRRHQSSSKPFLILLGGNTRSGKSSLATYLAQRFKQEGTSILRINLDDWILHRNDRKSFSVFDSFQMPKLVNDVAKILAGETVELPGYAAHPSWEAQPASYGYRGESVVLIEGVVALADEKLRERANLKIFKQISFDELEKRFADFYRWKGLAEDRIKPLYLNRKNGEYDLIAEHDQFADLVI